MINMRLGTLSAAVAAAFAALSCTTDATIDWAPAGENIRTAWAETIDPSNVHPEYPRPQLIRGEWQNLNGLWDYSVTSADTTAMAEAEGKILVPFCIESSLSGVGRSITDKDAIWYQRTFKIPSGWRGQNVILHFGAVDWEARVWVNGKEAGSHTGGYASFDFDITSFLKKGSKQTITVKVKDATDYTILQPRGKQVRNPGGVKYSPVSGIWQTVWLECVPDSYITDYLALSDIRTGMVTLETAIHGAEKGDMVKATFRAGGDVVATAGCEAGQTISTAIPGMHLWTPDDPFLYDIDIELVRQGKVIDKVTGYTAMRSISVKEDAEGNKRMALNDKILFQFGPLDQGWWPDGLYTAPSDEAMRFDLLKTKEYGFNMVRKHVKVEPDTWYRACDELGLLVWQDMPHFAYHESNVWGRKDNKYDTGTDFQATAEQKDNYYKEWAEIIAQHKKFPCIVVWVPFNEAWSQFDTGKTVDFTRSQDPTRLVNAASGGNWFKGQMGDIIDSHNYPHPAIRVWDKDLVTVLGEYGGIGIPVENHVWICEKQSGYRKYETLDDLIGEYVHFAGMLEELEKEGCAAAVYTQTTDVECEINGLMTYDREVVKIDIEKAREANGKVINLIRE